MPYGRRIFWLAAIPPIVSVLVATLAALRAAAARVRLVASGIVVQVIGDAQVAESIWRTPGNPKRGAGYESGHETSELGDLLAFAGGLAFAIAAGIARRVPSSSRSRPPC
ncbi:MAG TPA: hypothetical protein VMY78_02625 [Solirubrobacteraceae bacterium]|nr:hypothetical protein [Solirubrobacteraceae bacterium]